MPGTPGQGTNLIGHHGETTALISGSGRFYGGIERQQIGLLGNAVDHFNDVADAAALRRERTDQVGDPLHLSHQLMNGLIGMARQVVALIDIEAGFIGRA
ncbi:hypothetical protein CDAIGKPJ_02849 [Aeromonas salmonicida]